MFLFWKRKKELLPPTCMLLIVSFFSWLGKHWQQFLARYAEEIEGFIYGTEECRKRRRNRFGE